jgi:hypothetical protein
MPKGKKKTPTVETVPHTVSAEDLENNPELVEAGVGEGEEVGLPVVEEMIPETEEAAEAEMMPAKPSKTSFDVHASDGGYVRTYSVELHGEDAEKLAHQYAGKIGGTVR